VMPESAAAKAGLKAGDRLLTLDGRWTDSIADTYIAAGQLRPGMSAIAQVLRGKELLKLSVAVRAGL
jgi:S1-C subfamily serine protease